MAWQREMGWQRLDERGQERCVFACEEELCLLAGAGGIAINGSGLVYEYRVELDTRWQVMRTGIVAHLGAEEFHVLLERRDGDSWTMDGVHAAQLEGCTDVDFEFSASTNTLAIKRLGLEIGEEGHSRAVWILEPELKLDVLDQHYKRIDANRYEYSAGDYSTVLEVDDDDVVVHYPGLFEPALEQSLK
ncbi:MAG TPA: putative glycolipid-binding domain-containing protein [Coriobacteriia bacterium]|nr:putative glycolipid-binding domain-containing protein [Coriobacteriia bacterium]